MDEELIYDFTDGIALPEHRFLHGGTVYYRGDHHLPLTLVPWEQRYGPVGGWPLATTHGGRLYLLGRHTDWLMAERITLKFTPSRSTIARTSDAITLPDNAHAALVADLAAFMARRAGVDVAHFDVERESAASNFLDEINRLNTAYQFGVREVW